MALKESDIKKYSIQIAEKNEVFVWIGPCSVKKMEFTKIPLDGRKYECGGEVFLANGLVLQASFRMQKTNDVLLIEESVYTKIDGIWYKLNEPEFFEKTGLDKEDVFPVEWKPDIPLNHPLKGPYKMNWKG